ncbi:hypothetical protein [Rheinheimera sp.]|uniref:hypothetical protein n=1 Tax=Rheinheimera sp. TaxID=1869214 RepID=UPI0027B87CFD|nr:hypothetical protein [Rheinheimera sp.]
MSYQNYLPKRQTLMLLLFLLPVLVALDWRLHHNNRPLTQGDLIPDLPAAITTQNQTTSQLPAAYASKAAPEAAASAKTQLGLTADAQAKQQGLLSRLYIGEQIYRLRGIIQRNKTTALLQVENLQGGNKSRLELTAGDELPPYQVLEVSNKRIVLQQGERQLWLQLFVPAAKTTTTPSQP